MPAPHGQALALALFEVASAHDSPPCVTGKHPPASFNLVVEVHDAKEPREPAHRTHDQFELARVHVLAVSRDVPPAGKHEAGDRRRMVEHCLGCSR